MMALFVRIAPVIGLTLIALTSAEALLTRTLSIIGVTLVALRSIWIAIAVLAALATGDFPMIWNTSLALDALHVLQARTLSAHIVAKLYGAVGSQHITIALVACLLERIAPPAIAARFTPGTGGVIQTLQALAGV